MWVAGKLLLPSGYFRRTVDSVGAFFTEVRIASCKTMHSDANETQFFLVWPMPVPGRM